MTHYALTRRWDFSAARSAWVRADELHGSVERRAGHAELQCDLGRSETKCVRRQPTCKRRVRVRRGGPIGPLTFAPAKAIAATRRSKAGLGPRRDNARFADRKPRPPRGYRVDMAMKDQHRLSSRTTAELIRGELGRGDPQFAFRVMTSALADFRDAAPTDREDFLIPPASTGSIRWDTLLAAVVGRECDRLGISRPPWTSPPPLTEEWVVTTLPAPSENWVARIKAGTPAEFSRLGLWVHVRDLETL